MSTASGTSCEESKHEDEWSLRPSVNKQHKSFLQTDSPVVMYYVPPTRYSINFTGHLDKQKIIIPGSKSLETNAMHEIILQSDSMLSVSYDIGTLIVLWIYISVIVTYKVSYNY